MGVYLELPELRSFVKNMGEAIAGKVPAELIYKLKSLTRPIQCLCHTGFVYVHRGLLERMNSSDELALF